MNEIIKRYIRQLSSVVLLLAPAFSFAQTGAGSVSLYNGYTFTQPSDTTFVYSESLYLGPNTELDIQGVFVVYSKNIWIAPTAKLTGGDFIIANPDDNPFYPDMTGATTIDGNNATLGIGSLNNGISIIHRNPNNIILDDIDDPGFGTTNPSGALAAALNIYEGVFSFDVDNGDVVLNGNDLVVNTNASLANYGPARMVVTNNTIEGHLVKMNSTSTSFTFPVGIAEGDYTPAVITGSNNYSVSVIDYSTNIPIIETASEGMNRTWHVFGGAATSITLIHNSPSTDGSNYRDADAFITRYLGSGVWTSGASEQVAAGIHENSGAIALDIPLLGSVDASYITKTSDAITPLPVKLISFDAYKKGTVAELLWSTASEKNNRGFEVERSTDGSTFTKVGFLASRGEGGNSAVKLDYTFTDYAPTNGRNLYRLKQTDFDGKYEYSTIKAVNFDKGAGIVIFPNPAKGAVTIQGLAGDEIISVYDVTGRQVLQQVATSTSQVIDFVNLTEGMYHVRIDHKNGQTQTIKVAKMR